MYSLLGGEEQGEIQRKQKQRGNESIPTHSVCFIGFPSFVRCALTADIKTAASEVESVGTPSNSPSLRTVEASSSWILLSFGRERGCCLLIFSFADGDKMSFGRRVVSTPVRSINLYGR